jgi:hypothetical protein
VLRASDSYPPLDPDVHVALGQLMGAVARLERKVDALMPLRSEVHQIRRDVELDRGELVSGASSMAARHSSNRMAALVTSLFALYELASPFLREIWKAIHQ